MIVFGVKKYFYQQYSRLAEKENVIYKKINIYNAPECFKMWKSSAWIKIYKKDFILKNAEYTINKGKPVEKQGRKAKGLRSALLIMTAGCHIKFQLCNVISGKS